MNTDIKEMADSVVLAVRGVIAPLAQRIKALEARPTITAQEVAETVLPMLPKPIDGKDADLSEVARIVAEAIERAASETLTMESVRREIGKMTAQIESKPVDPAVIESMVSASAEKTKAALIEMLEEIPVPKDGVSVDPAEVQEMVKEAIAAIPIPKDGAQGDPGKDAAEIDPVVVDGAKAYPRGTYGLFRGGLIRSFRKTDPIVDNLESAGWDVVVDGFGDVVLEQIDERNFVASIERTSGKKIERTWKVNATIYRGIFSADREYETGDQVTYGGSCWIAERATTSKPSDGSGDWKLSVKRGRDGKDGAPGQKGDRGLDARDLKRLANGAA